MEGFRAIPCPLLNVCPDGDQCMLISMVHFICLSIL